MGWPGPTTHRQHEAHRVWLDEVWDEPTYSDWLIMRSAQRGHQNFAKNKSKVTVEEQRVEFSNRKNRRRQSSGLPDPRAATAASKARWMAVLKGFNPKVTPPTTNGST